MELYEVRHYVENKDGESYNEFCKCGTLATVRSYLLGKYNIEANDYSVKKLTMFESNEDMNFELEYENDFEKHTYRAYYKGEF